MLFCDWYLKNERIEMKDKDAKEMKAKKHGRSHAKRGLQQTHVTGAGLNTAN